MKKIKIVLAVFMAAMSVNVMATDSVAVEKREVKEKESIKAEPKGKAIVSVFANYNMAMQNGVSKCGFQLERTYLGY